MAKCCSASVVTVVTAVLLGCLIVMQIEAQSMDHQMPYIKPRHRQTKVHAPVRETPQTEQNHGFNQIPQHAVDRCAVADHVRVTCGHSTISTEECEALNCCCDGHRCYYGKGVTLHCTKTGEFILVVAKDLTVPSLDLETTSLLGQGLGCSHVDSNSVFAIYQFPVTSCGTIVMEESGTIIYENQMVSSYEVAISERGAITRESQFEFDFQCRYHGNSAVKAELRMAFDKKYHSESHSMNWRVTAWGSVNVQLMLANGQCTSKGCDDFMVAYDSFHTEYPVTKALREPVFVAVQLTGQHPAVHLVLRQCWATYGSSPHSLPQWDILIDGCPFENDKYLSKLIKVDSNSGLNYPHQQKRFMFQMFTFVNTQTLSYMSEQIYLHCSTYLCFPAQGHTCEPSCPANSYRNKRDVNTVSQGNSVSRVATVGPLIFHTDETQNQ